jgi:hypothetical protein
VCERGPGQLGEQRDALGESLRTGIVGGQLATDIAPVDRLAEDGGLPERERLEPRERLDVAPARAYVSLDELCP